MPYRSTYRCSECKSSFEKVTKLLPKKDPACPICKKLERVKSKSCVSDKTHPDLFRKEEIVGGTPDNPQKTFSMGGSARSAAFDKTAEIVMKDYGMTDINMNSNLRPGDDCVPKLRPDLEAKVGAGWGGANKKPVMGQAGSNLNSALTKQINAGAFRGHGDVVARQQKSGIKVPVNVIGEYNGKPS